jgi:hypothetical protein
VAAVAATVAELAFWGFFFCSFLCCLPSINQQVCGQSTPCGACTRSKCTSQLASPSLNCPWWLLLHSSFVHIIECVLLVFLLPALVVALLVSIVYNGAELGIQLDLAIESIESSGHCHSFLIVRRFGSPRSFGLEPVKLALG